MDTKRLNLKKGIKWMPLNDLKGKFNVSYRYGKSFSKSSLKGESGRIDKVDGPD